MNSSKAKSYGRNLGSQTFAGLGDAVEGTVKTADTLVMGAAGLVGSVIGGAGRILLAVVNRTPDAKKPKVSA